LKLRLWTAAAGGGGGWYSRRESSQGDFSSGMTAACTDCAIAATTTATAETATAKRGERERERRRSRGTEETGRRVVGYRGRAYNRTLVDRRWRARWLVGRARGYAVIGWTRTGMCCNWLEEHGDVLWLIGQAKGVW
jgi:hypothetical protein